MQDTTLAQRRNIHLWRHFHAGHALHRREFGKTLNPQRKTGRRGGLAAELFYQSVIASAGTDRALCAKLGCDPLEHCACVVIEAAYQTRVDAISDAGGVEQTA